MSKSVNLRLDEELYEQLRIRAKAKGIIKNGEGNVAGYVKKLIMKQLLNTDLNQRGEIDDKSL